MRPPTKRAQLLATSPNLGPVLRGTVVLGEQVLDAVRTGAAAVLYGTLVDEDGTPLYLVEAVENADRLDDRDELDRLEVAGVNGDPSGVRARLQRLGVVIRPGEPAPSGMSLQLGAPPAPMAAFHDGQPLRLILRDPGRYRDRVAALPDAEAVAGRAVLVVGLGSVGSDLGARLARLGARVIGVDPDCLAVENLIRWGLMVPMSCVGRSKARVFAETIERLVPGAAVAAERLDVVADGAAFEALIARSAPALLIAATDTRDSRRVVNAAAARFGIPALFVALSDGAASVRIEVVADARRGPCHLCSCFAEAGERAFVDRARSSMTPYAAQAGTDPQAVPALPVDIAIATTIATRIALTLLAGGDPGPLLRHAEQRGNVLFLSLRPDTWVFEEAWQRLIYAPARRAGCPVCGDDAAIPTERGDP